MPIIIYLFRKSSFSSISHQGSSYLKAPQKAHIPIDTSMGMRLFPGGLVDKNHTQKDLEERPFQWRNPGTDGVGVEEEYPESEWCIFNQVKPLFLILIGKIMSQSNFILNKSGIASGEIL